MPLKEYVNDEITKLKGLSFRKKAEYIWEYYKLWILAVAFSLILIISLITTIIGNSSNHSLLNVILLNTQFVGEKDTSLNENFIKYAGLEDTESNLTLDLSMTIDRTANDLLSMNANQKLIALFAADSIDTVISDEDNFLFLADSGGYLNLEEVLPNHLLEKYESSLYYTQSTENSVKRPYGIYLNNSEALKRDGLYLEDTTPIFGISTNIEDRKTAVLFLEFLLGE